MKIAIILGTRPEIIKMSPVIRECERLNRDYFILHSGQHYNYEMDQVFFEQLNLQSARYNLDVGSDPNGKQTGKMLIGMEKILEKEEPDIVLVQGDTNTVLAGALAASKLKIHVGHVEAGLRSYDRRMPEEINRIVADHLSDFLFAPTELSEKLLLHEGISEERIFVTGNTVVDAIYQNLKFARDYSTILNKLNLKSKEYFLATIHRQENVDSEDRLGNIAKSLSAIKNKFGIDVICPVHPRTTKFLKNFGITFDGIRCMEPLDYLSFLHIQNHARLIFTDSGGVQEEACILGVPCVTLRDNTERPETLQVGSNVLAGTSAKNVLEMTKKMLNVSHKWINPFGDGKSGQRIVELLITRLS